MKLKNFLSELLESCFNRPSRSPYGAHVLFQSKKDTSELRLCLDHCALKKQIVKKWYPVPLVMYCSDKFTKEKLYLVVYCIELIHK